MGKNLHHRETGIPVEANHPKCTWGVLHILYHHRWTQVRKKMLPHKRHGGERHAMDKQGQTAKEGGKPNIKEDSVYTTDSGVEENVHTEMQNPVASEHTPVTKSSMKSRIKAFIADERSKRKGRHYRTSSHPTRLQTAQTDSVHNVEASDSSPRTGVPSIDASPKIVCKDNENSSAVSTFDSLQSKQQVTSNKTCELCSTMLTVNLMGNNSQVGGEHGKLPVENDKIVQDKLNKAKQFLLALERRNSEDFDEDVSFHKSKQFLDVLDAFNMKKESFLKVLPDPTSYLGHYFHGRQTFSSRKGFTKSMSFPLAGGSSKRDFGPSKLKNEHQTECRVKMVEKTQTGSEVQKSVKLESTEGGSEAWVPLKSGSTIDVPKVYMLKPESLDNSSNGSTSGVKNREGNRVVTKGFKNLKKKIKHVIREGRKETHRITMDAVFHKIPYGRKPSKDAREEVAGSHETAAVKAGKSSSQIINEKDRQSGPQLSRKPSFDGSLDRYCQLYECSCNAEPKHHISGTLKLRKEGMPSPSRKPSKTLERILSLPDLRPYYLHHEDYLDATSSGMSIRTQVNNSVHVPSVRLDETLLDAPAGRGNQNLAELRESDDVPKDEMGSTSLANEKAEGEVDYTPDDLGSLNTAESDAQQENENLTITSLVSKLPEQSSISVLDSSDDDMASTIKFSVSEGSFQSLVSQHDQASNAIELAFPPDLENGSFQSFASQQDQAGISFGLAVAADLVNESFESFASLQDEAGISIKEFNSELLRVLVDTSNVDHFNFVKYALDLSGFSRDELLGMWHSPEQPLDPALFKEVEDYLVPELDSSETEEEAINLNHLLLFDVINEVLLEIHERSFTYWPVPLSSTSQIRPFPVGHHVLEEVWENIRWYLSWRPEVDQSLDDAVTRDLARSDGWMNLQFESECVCLELEDIIFDDLLDELVWT
ncbi:uncharacterized protein LOC127789540 isoform X2 [Diospyros lotus]|uniref:uncharacterized protein LOC127789540 isoform X2 n=1 Tax=Diospyros lotus TaxID=55363 RepID=UPI00224F4799|nr:uncharacterized protein LOC127789540 isoform X2 [Diospyros lotus]